MPARVATIAGIRPRGQGGESHWDCWTGWKWKGDCWKDWNWNRRRANGTMWVAKPWFAAEVGTAGNAARLGPAREVETARTDDNNATLQPAIANPEVHELGLGPTNTALANSENEPLPSPSSLPLQLILQPALGSLEMSEMSPSENNSNCKGSMRMSFEIGSPFGGSQGNQRPGQPEEPRQNTNDFAEENVCEEPEPEAVAKKLKISASEEFPPEQPTPNTQTILPHRRQELKTTHPKV